MKISPLLILYMSSITLILSGPAYAQTAGTSYTLRENDWLSKISEKAYGNPHLYYRIIEATNEKALMDKSYRPISSANTLKAGQKVWIPDHTSSSPSVTGEGNLVTVPKTNCEIRIWYNYQVVAISKLNEKWIADGTELETRAREAYRLRHNARVNARFMMQDKEEVKQFQERDLAKYGNPDGPTFDFLLNNFIKEGHTKEEGYEKIIVSASTASPVYNNECVHTDTSKN